MDDFDLLVINTYLNLAKGDIDSPLRALDYKKQFIEEKIKSVGGRTFPADLILFSQRYNHACLVEIKNTSTSDFNDDQAQGYNDLNHTSLSSTLPGHRELARISIDVAYHGHVGNEQHLADGLRGNGVNFPLLIFDHENFKIRRSAEAGDFNFRRIKNAFDGEIILNIDDLDKIIPYVKFSIETDNYKIAQTVIPELIKRAKPISAGEEVATIPVHDLTRDTYSMLGLPLWNQLNAEYRKHLIRKVRDTLVQLRDEGMQYIKMRDDNKYVGLDIYDEQGDINQATLTAIKQRISQAAPTLVGSQTTIV